MVYPFNIQPVQALLPIDFASCMKCCTGSLKTKPTNRILLTYEATFTSDGLMNRKNGHSWDFENPYYITESNYNQRFTMNTWYGIINHKSNSFLEPFSPRKIANFSRRLFVGVVL